MPTSVAPRGQRLLLGSAILITAALLGSVVFGLIQQVFHIVWHDFLDQLPTGVAYGYIVVVPALAGAGVAWFRSHGGAGHQPLGGLTIAPLRCGSYPATILAVAIGLIGGVVLGPEVALVTTGAVIGTEFSRKWPVLPQSKAVLLGVIGAVLTLFYAPVVNQSFMVASNYQFTWADVLVVLVAAAVATGVLMLGRLLAMAVSKLVDARRPHPLVMAGLGGLIGAAALVAVLTTDVGTTSQTVALVLGSGEHQVKELLAIDSLGAMLLIVGLKWAAYAVSLGGGFRGGPFFPALFVGSGVGYAVADALSGSTAVAAAAGLVAAFSFLAHAKWPATIVLGLVLGVLVGGWQAIIIGVVAAAVARLFPLVGRDQAREQDHAGEQAVSGQSAAATS